MIDSGGTIATIEVEGQGRLILIQVRYRLILCIQGKGNIDKEAGASTEMTQKTTLARSTSLPSPMQVKLILLITKHVFHLNPRLIVRLPTAKSEAPNKTAH